MDGFWSGGHDKRDGAIKDHYAAKVNELQQQCDHCTDEAKLEQLRDQLEKLKDQYRQEMQDADDAIH